MKLYSVGAIWRNKGDKKRSVQRAIIMAESREKAVQKFNKAVSYPADSVISVSEWEDGIYTLAITKI